MKKTTITLPSTHCYQLIVSLGSLCNPYVEFKARTTEAEVAGA